MNAIELKSFWNQLIGIANEQARALKRVAFSPVVTQTGDLSVSICDAAGRSIANAETGAPGHMNTISNTIEALIRDIPPESLSPGDVLITNDPWSGSGHLFDVSIVRPVFDSNCKLIAFTGCNVHHTDIGGYGIGSGARDIHEEGLWLPPLKLYDAGTAVAAVFQIIARNVRTPDEVLGDLAAQVACTKKAEERILRLCEIYSISDFAQLTQQILDISERATRLAIRKLAAGIYRGHTIFDVLGGDGADHIIELKVALTVDPDLGEITADFAGSSAASRFGINVVAGYAHAYVRFAVKCCLNADVPNNSGSHVPIKFIAPEGSILEAAYPAPVAGRHIIAMTIPMAVMNALYPVLPDDVMAESVGGRWGVQLSGRWPDDLPFATSIVSFTGGMGARASKSGLSVTPFPTGNATIPIEIVEATTPIVFDRKEIALGTGGKGRQRGGGGEVVRFRLRANQPWQLNALITKSKFPTRGLGGGGDGEPGWFRINGHTAPTIAKRQMAPGDIVELQTPGGGGFGSNF